jgi:hypothetical protein
MSVTRLSAALHDPARWRQIERYLDEALDIEPGVRAG